MDMATLLKSFADPNIIKTMEQGDLFTGVMVTVVMGMGITFAVLIILQFVMGIMAAILVKKPESPKAAVQSASAASAAPAKGDNQELIAVISAAVAAALGTSVGNIVVKNVRKSVDSSPAWHKAAVADQMNTRF